MHIFNTLRWLYNSYEYVYILLGCRNTLYKKFTQEVPRRRTVLSERNNQKSLLEDYGIESPVRTLYRALGSLVKKPCLPSDPCYVLISFHLEQC